MQPWTVATIGMAMIAISLILRTSYRRSRSGSRPKRQPFDDRRDAVREVQRSLEQTMLELDELSRQIHGRIDTKLARLESLLRDADVRIEKLSRVTPEPETPSPRLEVVLDEENPLDEHAARAGRRRSAPPPSEKHRRVEALAEEGLDPPAIARRSGIPIGEVELILALRKARSAEAGSTPAP
ncbi:MAG: hypothetical protein D6788_04190 [Planctomycetota bacterium]|nr:MAG: hypothetical protein D6788_04190 [Planctomycetota bacterium]